MEERRVILGAQELLEVFLCTCFGQGCTSSTLPVRAGILISKMSSMNGHCILDNRSCTWYYICGHLRIHEGGLRVVVLWI